jgi:hypothetical protein
MQFAIGMTVLECYFVKHSHGHLGVKLYIKERFKLVDFLDAKQLSTNI